MNINYTKTVYPYEPGKETFELDNEVVISSTREFREFCENVNKLFLGTVKFVQVAEKIGQRIYRI